MSAEMKPQWGASYRLIAAEKWKAKSAAMGKAATQALVNYAAPREGMNVLDVASGTGEPGISIASRVGHGGQVTALDLSADLLQIAEGRARQRNLSNFSTQQGDVHELPFADQSFDLITCRLGVMFFAQMELSLQECRRVLKPGARACFLAWGPFDQPYWSNTMGVVHRHIGGPLMAPGTPDMFRFATKGSLKTALEGAGFADVQEVSTTLPWNWPGEPEEVWEYAQAVSTPFRPLLERVPAEKWEAINAEVLAAIRGRVEQGIVKFGAEFVLASGRA